jgi:hypothetical protein
MNFMQHIENAVTAFDGVEAAPHRYGGREFTFGKVEIGHIHRSGMVDIPFTRKIRDVLIAEGHAEHHHLLHESGWISFYIRQDADLDKAIWLYTLSYLHKTRKRQPNPDLLRQTPMSDALYALIS